ncbi:MAG: DAK2 domain fusion protein YloV [Actinomycetes bacterium]
MHDSLDAEVIRAWAATTVASLGECRAEIDALNVFPVPDGDTGTNLFLTAEAAAAAVEEHFATGEPVDVVAAAQVYAKGALLGARGNSGVITSQILRGIAEQIAQAPEDQRPGELLATALTRASELAYGAVGVPREGTVLTVSRVAAKAASDAAMRSDATLEDVSKAALAGAEEALAKTPEQLEVLRDAGVVDSGGRGLVVILEALVEAVTGERKVRDQSAKLPTPVVSVTSHTVSYGGPGYEVMYLLEAGDEQVRELREELGALGDSLVVVGGGGLWNVHVHVDDVGAAVEAGIDAGRPYRIKVTHLELANVKRESGRGEGGPATAERTGRAVVTVSHGPGVAALLLENNVTAVPAEPGRRPSTAELLGGVLGSGAREVVLLPSDGDTRVVAEAAAEQARDDGIRVAVIPTRSIVQSLAAVAVHDPSAVFDDDVVAMGRSSAATRYGAITVAVRQAVTTAGVCEIGDVLGLVGGDIAVIGSSLSNVAAEVLNRMLDAGGELVTVVAGEQADQALIDVVERVSEEGRSDVEVEIVMGGQPLWPLIIGVE